MTKNDQPLISVVLPVFNGAATITETVSSVLSQQHVSLELLVIDDGSTDATVQVLSDIDDARLKVHSFSNQGLAASRNRGIARAEGQYVSFIDADDLWTADKLHRQLEALKADPEAGMAYSLTDCIDESGRVTGPGGHIVRNGDVYSELLIRNFIESGSNVMIPVPVFARTGTFDESLQAAEDWDLCLRIALAYKVVCVPAAQILYRIHSGAMSSNIDRQVRESFRVFDAALENLPAGHDARHVERDGLANLNRYFARRIISTAASPAAARTAWPYLWRWLRLSRRRAGLTAKFLVQTVQLVLLSCLPHSIIRPVLNRIQRAV